MLAEIDAETSQTTPLRQRETDSFSAQRERVKTGARLVDKTWIRVNDPSAGSPTER